MDDIELLNQERLIINRKKARVVLLVSLVGLIISLVLASVLAMLLVLAFGLSSKQPTNLEIIKSYLLIFTPSLLSLFFIIVSVFIYKGKRWAIVFAPYVWIIIIALFMLSRLFFN
jgi:hypothetical protein